MMEQVLTNPFHSRVQATPPLRPGVGGIAVMTTFDTVPDLILIHGLRLCGLPHTRADSFILD